MTLRGGRCLEYTFGHQNGFLSIDKCESSRTSTFETYDRRQIGLSEHRRMRILVDVDVGVPYHTHGAYKRSCSPQEPSLDTRFLHGGQDHTPSAKPLSHDWRPTTLRGVVRRSHSVLMASFSTDPPPAWEPCMTCHCRAWNAADGLTPTSSGRSKKHTSTPVRAK